MFSNRRIYGRIRRFFIGKTSQIKVWGIFVSFFAFAITFLGSVSEILLLRRADLMSS